MNTAKSSRSFAFYPEESQTTGSTQACQVKLRKNVLTAASVCGAGSALISHPASRLFSLPLKILGWENSSKATTLWLGEAEGRQSLQWQWGSQVKGRSSCSETSPKN